jgi:hypothetical protein
MENNELFLGGIPTGPDVEKLIATLGIPTVGAVISYKDIADVLALDFSESRFRTVTNAWRGQLYRQHNLLLDAVARVGFKVLDGSQRITFSSKRFKRGLKGIRRAGDVASKTAVAGLTPDELKARDHVASVATSLQLAAAVQARKLRELPAEIKRVA